MNMSDVFLAMIIPCSISNLVGVVLLVLECWTIGILNSFNDTQRGNLYHLTSKKDEFSSYIVLKLN